MFLSAIDAIKIVRLIIVAYWGFSVKIFLSFILPSLLSHAGVGGEAGVDGQHHAGDGAGGLVVAQEEHTAQQLAALHEPVHGGARQNLGGAGGGGAVLVEEELPVLVGHQEPGAMALQRMPVPAKWVASHWVKLEMAALAPE